MRIKIGELKDIIQEVGSDSTYALIGRVHSALEKKIIANARQIAGYITLGNRRGEILLAHELLDQLFKEATAEAQGR